MEFSGRNESKGYKRLLLLLGAAAGTFLLIFVPAGDWQGQAASPQGALLAASGKAVLTLALLSVVPSLWAGLIHRTSWIAAVALVLFAFGCGWLILGDAADALFPALLAALPGAGLYVLQRLKLSNFRTVLYGSFLTLGGLFAQVCLKDLIRRGDAYLPFREAIDLFEQAANSMSLEEIRIAGVTSKDLIAAYILNAEAIFVPLLLVAAMCASLSNTLFSHLWNRDGAAALPKLKPFREWRCERWYVLFAAVFSIATMLLGMFGLQAFGALSSVAEVMWRLPCSLAGLCAVRRIAVRAGRGWVFWIVCAGTVLLPSIASMLLTLLGMLSSLRNPWNAGEDGKRI